MLSEHYAAESVLPVVKILPATKWSVQKGFLVPLGRFLCLRSLSKMGITAKATGR